MNNRHSVYLLDVKGNFNIFGTLIFIIAIIPIFILQIIELINSFNIYNILICIILGSLIYFSLYALRLVRNVENNYNDAIEKIITNKDTIEVIYYHKYQKQKIILSKSDIEKFYIDFDASIFGSFGTNYRSVNYSATVEICTLDSQSYKIHYTFQSRGIIKSIFKIAKYIPNFSYTINNDCVPVISESINKMAQTGKGLNLFEFANFMLSNPTVSKRAKLETYFWIIVLLLIITFILLMIFNMELCNKIVPYVGVCFINIIGPLIIVMLIISFILKDKS